MRIFPFHGTRYAPAAGDPGRLAAPPYDQIDAETRDRLHAEPLQFSQLTVPTPDAEPDPARHSATLHRQWLERGILERDPRGGVYPYEILTAGGGRRLGLCALVGLETPDSGVVVPHEQTVTRFVEDRLRMLRATACDLEPILILADDRGPFDESLAAAAAEPPLVEHLDPHGHRHRLYPAAEAAPYSDLLAGAQGVIADGNTRWQTARTHATELGIAIGKAGAEIPQATKLAVITSLESPGVVIDPIHRGLAAADRLEEAAALAADIQPWSGDSGAALAAAVAAAPQPALGVNAAGRPIEIWRLGTASELGPERAALVACRLHDELLPRLGLPPASATDGTVIYRSDPDKLWQEQASGALAAGFYLPPMSPRIFGEAIAGGELMPPKSTRFLPKLVSGLVWHDQRR